MFFYSWLNMCFLNVYGVQGTEQVTVFKPRNWFLSLSVLYNLGLGKFLRSKSCAGGCTASSLFSGVLLPQVLTDLGALALPLQVCENAKGWCCFLQFSFYALCSESENAWREKLKEQVQLPQCASFLSRILAPQMPSTLVSVCSLQTDSVLYCISLL